MTSHKDDNDGTFQATIDALSHTSIPTKLAVIESLDADLLAESTALETQRAQLHKHKQKIAGLVSDLQSIQSGVEYTIEGGGGGSSTPLPSDKVIYVNSAYSGGSDSGSREHPYASLAAAITAKCGVADPDERIFDVAAGTYTVSKTIVKDNNVKQRVTFRGRGQGITVLQAAATFVLGKNLDCLKLENFGALRFEGITIQNCRYGIRSISCDELDVIGCKFLKCGVPAVIGNHNGSLSQPDQVTAYTTTMTSGGALRVESALGLVRILDNVVEYCFRGLRVSDSVKGGLIRGNFVSQTAESGIYLSSSTYDGANGCQNFVVSENHMNQCANNSILQIGGRNNTVSGNLCRNGFNSGVQCWSVCETNVVGNKIEKCNMGEWNGLGVLADSWAGGVSVDGSDNIPDYSTYQVKIFDNQITECAIGRAAQNYAIRIKNEPFVFPATDKCYVGGNQSSDADVHFQNDESCTIIDMNSRTQPGVFSGAEKTQILADVVTLQTAHPITPRVVEPVNDDDEINILATDRLVFVKHSEVSGLICTLPSTGMANGMTVYIKNLQTGSNPQRGWGSSPAHAVKVRPAQGQNPAHTLDFRFSELTLEPSDSVGNALDNENESCRLVWLSSSNTWCQTSDSY